MILLLLAQAASPPADQSCIAQVRADPARAVQLANAWHLKGGGALARQCLGLAYVAQERWASAAVAFEQAAREAEAAQPAAAANLWVQAGNARLAAQEFAPARAAFDAALASGDLQGIARGETRLDRARANVALEDLASARADLDEALKLVPEDPLAWLLSATLARRTGDLARAQADIAKAATLSPDDAQVALEAGTIALRAGAPAAARIAFDGAIKVQPDSDAARLAKAALDRLELPVDVGERPLHLRHLRRMHPAALLDRRLATLVNGSSVDDEAVQSLQLRSSMPAPLRSRSPISTTCRPAITQSRRSSTPMTN